MADPVKPPFQRAAQHAATRAPDRIAMIAQEMTGAPIAAVTMGSHSAHAVADGVEIPPGALDAIHDAFSPLDAPQVVDDLSALDAELARHTGLQAVGAVPIRAPSGDFIGAVWAAADCACTLREKTMEHLQRVAWLAGPRLDEAHRSASHFEPSPYFESRGHGLVVTGQDGRIVWANPSFAELCGYPLDELTGRRPSTLLQGPETDEAVVDAMRSSVQAGRGFKAQLVNYRKSGEPYWVQIQAEPLRAGDGEVTGFIALETEISVPHRPVQEGGAPALFATVVDTVDALVVIVDKSGRIVRFNEAAQTLTGYSADDVIGDRLVNRLLPSDAAEAVTSALNAHRAGEAHCTFECPCLSRDGEQRLIDWSTAALRDGAGGVQYVVLTGIDITKRRQLEQELLQVSDEERRRIGQDLHDILASHLAGTAMVAQSLSQRRSRGEPISVDDLDLIVEHIHEAAQQARALSHSLMPARLGNNRLEKALRQLASNKEELTGVPHTVHVQADLSRIDDETATHLYRIAYEAINNAIKHAQPSQVCTQLRDDGGRLLLTVQDDGVGIAGAGDASQGLGLRMMKHRAELIGACLEVAPVEGGTLVRCALPLDAEVSSSE